LASLPSLRFVHAVGIPPGKLGLMLRPGHQIVFLKYSCPAHTNSELAKRMRRVQNSECEPGPIGAESRSPEGRAFGRLFEASMDIREVDGCLHIKPKRIFQMQSFSMKRHADDFDKAGSFCSVELPDLSHPDLRFLKGSKATLTTLHIPRARGISFARLDWFEQLKSLNLDHSGIRNLKPIAKLRSLRTLTLVGTKVRTLRLLRKHPSIEHLNLSGTRINDLSVLRSFPALTILEVDKLQWPRVEGWAQESLSLLLFPRAPLAP